jgi:hypothetical protein
MWNEKWTSALRAEHYQDKDGVLVNTGTLNGFKTSGISINFDYSPFKNIVWRIEGRRLTSSDKIFERQNKNVNKNFAIASSVAVQF